MRIDMHFKLVCVKDTEEKVMHCECPIFAISINIDWCLSLPCCLHRFSGSDVTKGLCPEASVACGLFS